MAQRVHTILISDLTGKDIADGAGETVSFTVREVAYELDLTSKEAAQLDKDLAKYVNAARRVKGRRKTSTQKPKHTSEDLPAIREWARQNGHTVSDRGRIPSHVMDAYRRHR